MATLNEANEALKYLQGRIDTGSMVGAHLVVIGAYLNEMLAAENKPVVAIDAPTIDEHFKRLRDVTREEVEKAHDFFKQWDNIKIVVSKVTDERRAQRMAPNISVSGTTAAGVALLRGRSK